MSWDVMAGVGNALGQIGGMMWKDAEAEDDFKRKTKLEELRDQLEMKRQKALAEIKNELENAPLMRFGELAKRKAGEEVPQEPAKVTSLSGYDPKAADVGPPEMGLMGDLKKVVSDISTMKDGPDRQGALDQAQRQLDWEQQRATEAVAGKTRKRTTDEAVRAAGDEARINDPVAYAAYEAKIGKPARDERKLDIQENRDLLKAARDDAREEERRKQDDRRYELQLKKELQADARFALNEKKTNALLDHWLNQDAAKMGAPGSAERSTTIINSMNSTIKNLLDQGKPADKAAGAAWQAEYDGAVEMRRLASARLKEAINGTSGGQSETPAPSAAPKASAGIPEPKTKEERDKLAPGTLYRDPSGTLRTR